MEPLRKKLRFWKNYFFRILPQCVLYSVLLYALSLFVGSLFNMKSEVLNKCADLTPGEVAPYKSWESKPKDLYYDTVFTRLYNKGYISSRSKVLSIDCIYGQDIAALRKLGLVDVKGVPYMPSASFIISGQGSIPFENNTFDFEFFGYTTRFKYWTEYPAHTASEIGRTLNVGGYAVVHVLIDDGYSMQSFMNLFSCCMVVSTETIAGLDSIAPTMHEFIFKKKMHDSNPHECTGLKFKKHIVNELEPIVTFYRPSHWEGPWGSNRVTLRYVPTMADLSFKERYIYIDVGANSYNSSIGIWFNNEYPKQNKPFEIYAIEPDATFHEELKGKPGVTLLPYVAWLKNETLTFQIYKLPEFGEIVWDVMGYVADDKEIYGKEVIRTFSVPAFDFTEWFLNTVTNRDYVMVKIDVEGDEFKLLKKMSEDGVLNLIDELFVECHHDYPGFEFGPRQKKTLSDCTELFTNLRKDGVAVHQWW